MQDIYKRQIMDICTECMPSLILDNDFNSESRIDVENKMFILGIDVSNEFTGIYDMERYNRYN